MVVLVEVAGHNEPLSLRCFILKQPVEGAVIFWDLPSLYHGVLPPPQTMSASSWYNSWWPWWMKFVASMDLPASHLRRATLTKHKQHTPDDAKHRVFDKPACSSQVLLSLVVRLASPTKGRVAKNERTRQAWQSILQSLLQRAVSSRGTSSPLVLHFFWIPTPYKPGYPLQGEDLATLQVTPSCMVDLSPVFDSHRATADDLKQALLRLDSHVVPLHSLLIGLDQFGRKGDILRTQLVHSLAEWMDGGIHLEQEGKHRPGEAQSTDGIVIPSSRFQVAAARRAAKASKVKKCILWKEQSRRRTIWKHSIAVRQAMQNQQCYSVSFDASRIGGRQHLFGCLHTGGLTAWLPPQVWRGDKWRTFLVSSRGQSGVWADTVPGTNCPKHCNFQ